jgi:hypothetical protein
MTPSRHRQKRFAVDALLARLRKGAYSFAVLRGAAPDLVIQSGGDTGKPVTRRT